MSEMWGIPSPTNRGPKNHLFSTTSQFNGNCNGLSLERNTRGQSCKCLDN